MCAAAWCRLRHLQPCERYTKLISRRRSRRSRTSCTTANICAAAERSRQSRRSYRRHSRRRNSTTPVPRSSTFDRTPSSPPSPYPSCFASACHVRARQIVLRSACTCLLPSLSSFSFCCCIAVCAFAALCVVSLSTYVFSLSIQLQFSFESFSNVSSFEQRNNAAGAAGSKQVGPS